MSQSSVLPRILAYHLLEEMTDGFSEDRELGRGTYGKVYLGLHKDDEKIAVKMLHPMLVLDDKQFKKEYHNLEHLQHPNIVRLVGYCNETSREFVSFEGKRVLSEVTHKALCFEYMQNGSLDTFLSDESSGHDWHTRYSIIKGICKGLQYLHEELEPPIFHLDMKPANILLDENKVAKIADFGLSKLMGTERTHITTSPIGTIGYLPPEYINRNVISNKLDIFSLGVIIIKIMAGPTGYSQSAEISSQEFIDLVHENWKNRLQEASMEALESYCEQVKRCVTIALTCVEVDRHKRPTIGDIVIELNATENISQFPDVSRNNQVSSLGQGRRQTPITEEEEEEEEEERESEIPNTVENLFGVVVDNSMLNKMVRYKGKPKTQEDRAREALIMVNENDKESKASKYVYSLVPYFFNKLGPQCLVYNVTGNTLYQVAEYDWCGHISRAPYPTEIGNGQWAAFRHSTVTGEPGSLGAVVYRGKNKDDEDQDYVISWFVSHIFLYRNKSYCEIGGVDKFRNQWRSLATKTTGSAYSSNAMSGGCKIEAKISMGTCPKFTAIISYC